MFNEDLRPKVEILERTVNDCVAMLGEQSEAFSSAMKRTAGSWRFLILASHL